ncbi:MAG: bacterioferritin [Gammaproteobacteria bacterium]|nr:MAG: bacterioferritin [Gammaproteobacteria bacterium]RLA11134.1 MAG: bacterioferritin [Gammaproteobacteria bacterium]
MYVCLCRGITEKQVVKKITAGVNSVAELQQTLGAGVECGKCCDYMQEMLRAAALETVAALLVEKRSVDD